ncbi:helix-turn-helix transcriptional regulator [Altibacter sp. HG106]|uniref:helix-turn-helix transcriptional regulator n=1 Tax=Altibacter sp. HG106 TaxID=3023937 RepID=UPI00300FC065
MNTIKHNIMLKKFIHSAYICSVSINCIMEKQVYNRIKAVLAEKGKTNNWLADQLEMNRTTISKWCRNDMQPRIETLFQIAKVLEIDVRLLLISTDSKT